jgi:glucose uptake protein GlcU
LSKTALGFLISILGSVSFGAYILPRKLSRLSVLEYQFWLSLVIFPLCAIAAVLAGAGISLSPPMLGHAVLCGVLWTFGSLSYSAAVDNIGVTRSTPIKNMAPVFAAIYGILIFHEYTLNNPASLATALGGVACMAIAAYWIGGAGAPEHEKALAFNRARSEGERSSSFRRGILFSLSAAFFYGAYSLPLKFLFKHNVSAYSACAWLGAGVLITTLVILIFREHRVAPKFPGSREFLLAQSAGAIWTSGQVLGAVAMFYIPMSISWPISNLGTLVAVGWGVLLFKEVHIEAHVREFTLGLFVYVTGLALLAFAAPAGHV